MTPFGPLRTAALTIPSVTLKSSPPGFPTAITFSPVEIVVSSSNIAGLVIATFSKLRSRVVSNPIMLAGSVLPSLVTTLMSVRFSVTW